MLAIGIQLGRWPAWSVAIASVGYLVWVLAYSEATVQASVRPHGERGPGLAGSD
jgi:hypothetical protein